LIFTKVDETQQLAPLATTARTSHIAVSFIAGGKQVLEDLNPAAAETIARFALRESA
jgi:flagellar biosynthesis GTPase FlhF